LIATETPNSLGQLGASAHCPGARLCEPQQRENLR